MGKEYMEVYERPFFLATAPRAEAPGHVIPPTRKWYRHLWPIARVIRGDLFGKKKMTQVAQGYEGGSRGLTVGVGPVRKFPMVAKVNDRLRPEFVRWGFMRSLGVGTLGRARRLACFKSEWDLSAARNVLYSIPLSIRVDVHWQDRPVTNPS